MTDLVDRLRATDGTVAITTILDRCNEAADEIERLRAALRQISRFSEMKKYQPLGAQAVDPFRTCVTIARAALEPKP